MTVDGHILELLIRELILKEFKIMMDSTKHNADEIRKIKSTVSIESQKLLDTTMRLKRL
mgnify:CR=1 FL=1